MMLIIKTAVGQLCGGFASDIPWTALNGLGGCSNEANNHNAMMHPGNHTWHKE
jgi:hypothetical protein